VRVCVAVEFESAGHRTDSEPDRHRCIQIGLPPVFGIRIERTQHRASAGGQVCQVHHLPRLLPGDRVLRARTVVCEPDAFAFTGSTGAELRIPHTRHGDERPEKRKEQSKG
jgi:hypothetical protein